MYLLRQFALLMFFFFVVSTSAHCATWEEGDGQYFEQGDLAAVKRILSKETYSGDLLIEAFQTSARSGNIDLVKYLEKRGWAKVCRNDKRCDPVLWAVLGKKQPKMVSHLLSLGFAPTSASLFMASALVTPEDEDVASSLEAVKILCQKGANPMEKQRHADGPTDQIALTVLEELEKRIAEPHMDLGSTRRDARGMASEILVAEFFRKGACRKGAATSTEFDNFLANVRAMREGNLPPALQTMRLKPQVERYFLYEAIASGSLYLLEHLKNQGWISRCRQHPNCRPIDVAAEIGVDLKVFQFLTSEGFEIDSRNASGGTPLMYAALNARVSAVRFLCEQGADYRKQVKLEIYDRSIISILRRAYSSAWCNAVVFGAHAKAVQEAVRQRCEGEGGVFGGPQSSISIPECVPGTTCMSISFPPKGREHDVRELRALAEIFQYFKNGECKSTQTIPTCTSYVASKAVIIGSNVNLRAAPNMTGERIEILPFGTVMEVLDTSGTCDSQSGRIGRWIKTKVLAYPQLSDQRLPTAIGWVFDTHVDYFPSFEP